MRFRRWRLIVIVLLLLLVGTAAWLAWQGWHAMRDLQAAESSADKLKASLTDADPAERDRAIAGLQDSARSAKGRTDGPLWGALTHLPFVGDDVTGVRAISSSLDTLASDGVPPLVETVDGLDGVTSKGRIDLDVVASLEDPVSRAHAALDAADDDVAGLDSSGYVGPLKSRFDRYVDLVGDAVRGLSAGDKAVAVLPTMAGADGPRDYLLVFQNNAEIRATGGMPGSWALVHAEDGKVEMVQQGTASEFSERKMPILPLSKSELAVYDEQLGTYFQDANFTPDFPRAAELWSARWQEQFPGTHLDGVISLDPVAMSYLLRGIGTIEVGDLALTPENLVDELLNEAYINLEPAEQNALFAEVARVLFDSVTGHLTSPVDFVDALDQAAHEGRFRVAVFDHDVQAQLAGTNVEGALAGDGGQTPHVDVGLNDATGSKMSYYLRYWGAVNAVSCEGGTQRLDGSMTFKQVISPKAAAALPASITGGGISGTDPGSQLVLVRIYGPAGGTIDSVRLNGRSIDADLKVVELGARPVATLVVLLSSRKDTALNWTMTTGPDQPGDGRLAITPSIVPGAARASFASAC